VIETYAVGIPSPTVVVPEVTNNNIFGFGYHIAISIAVKRKAKFVDKFEQFTRNCFAVD